VLTNLEEGEEGGGMRERAREEEKEKEEDFVEGEKKNMKLE